MYLQPNFFRCVCISMVRPVSMYVCMYVRPSLSVGPAVVLLGSCLGPARVLPGFCWSPAMVLLGSCHVLAGVLPGSCQLLHLSVVSTCQIGLPLSQVCLSVGSVCNLVLSVSYHAPAKCLSGLQLLCTCRVFAWSAVTVHLPSVCRAISNPLILILVWSSL